jgi:Ca2+-transporting ATPase
MTAFTAKPAPPGIPMPHACSAAEVVERLATDAERGLSEARAEALRTQVGPNELPEAPPTPAWRRFLRQFRELVVLILIAAAVLAGVLGEWMESLAILAIVLLNGVIGFFQEQRAEGTLKALRRLAIPTARVIREGKPQIIPARDLVPGDIIQLEAGDHVPADARLLQAFGLRVEEAPLTGESVPEDKDAAAILAPDTPLGDRRNMVYWGTAVVGGKGKAVVVATGMNTELGHIAGLLAWTEPEPTPLQRRLAELGRILTVVVLAIIAIVFVLRLFRGGPPLEVFLFSVSLAVAAVPEGLPAVVTVALALGLQRLVKRNALVRRLPSVETLGSVTLICSDKTGTLTRNEMTVRQIAVAGGSYHVTGVGYEPRGQFLRQPEGTPADPWQEPDLLQALRIGAYCNNARVQPRPSGKDWQVIGDPTEGALLVVALKAGIDLSEPARHVSYEVPFDSERKMMSVVVRHPAGSPVLYSKGAPEVILPRCVAELRGGDAHPLAEKEREEILGRAAAMAGRALRVLALAYRPYPRDSTGPFEEAELTFAGLVGMIDPPREEAREAVRTCHEAGIRPIMITGDHPTTALAIARELQIVRAHDRAVTGPDLDRLDDDRLAEEVEQVSVYARVTAEHKLRVVRAWKGRGQVVAMTGDGVNDAPALKAADIGIAMGVAGSDVTREAAAMVLLDDNFASIVSAIEEGRTIYDNIRKVVHYLLSSNVSEVLLVFAAALLGWPSPLAAVQLLWLNLVSDGLPALALGVEPPERDVMRRRPRRPHEPVISWADGRRMLLHGTLLAAVGLAGFAAAYQGEPDRIPHARTMTFCVLAFSQLLFAVACRSQRFTLPELGLWSNPQLLAAIVLSSLLQLTVVTLAFARPVFEVATELDLTDWALTLGLAALPVTLIEIGKLLGIRRRA